ncbi:hypothetical protein PHYBOEH_001624 [Phytophthora boehmeriae]|uniref:Peptidase S1 domain-containing protein n=1 Tax=Phytophthora boehmeriae TaxID=109152 RepID=A0A8T1WSQ2_9STRA|nr:hypothetical protein PHYBOEH_001624 [Phytophthora boehmeriae]
MKLTRVLAFASTLVVAVNGYSFSETLDNEPEKKESTGLTVNEESRIYGGKEVDVDDYPFAVNLRMDFFDESFCGGALIDPEWILTAGHCIKTDEFDIIAVLGSQERAGTAGEQIKVVEGYRHPQYNKTKHLYDIGLLKLAKPSTHETVPICARDGSDNEVGTVATIVGWGLTENRTQSDTLLGVNVEIITNAQCNKQYDTTKKKNRITEGMLCAGKGDGKDSCNGDSGGPLVANDILVGIASWGRKCGARPGVYTRLTYVMDYIKDILNGGDGSKFAASSSGSGSSSLLEGGSTASASNDASATGSSATSSESGSTSTSSASTSNSDASTSASDSGSVFSSSASASNADYSSSDASTSVSSDSDSGSASSTSASSAESLSTDASNSASSASETSSSMSSNSESTSSSGSNFDSAMQFTKQESIDDVTQQSTEDVTQQSTLPSKTSIETETPATKSPSKKRSKTILLLDDEI